MSPELKQLYARADLNQKLLIDRVLTLVKNEEEERKALEARWERRHKWAEFMYDGLVNEANGLDRFEKERIGRALQYLRNTFEELYPEPS
jgi:hypothetical protein